MRWLNHELELSTHVTDVETDFASGYLLGEILHRLNHQRNFADFMRSSSADAKILNFCLLEPTLRNLNIKFDANAAAAIMNEKKDAAANLLYQIKVKLRIRLSLAMFSLPKLLAVPRRLPLPAWEERQPCPRSHWSAQASSRCTTDR